MSRDARKRAQAAEVRRRLFAELDKSATVFAGGNVSFGNAGGNYRFNGVSYATEAEFNEALQRELTVGHAPVRFKREYTAEL